MSSVCGETVGWLPKEGRGAPKRYAERRKASFKSPASNGKRPARSKICKMGSVSPIFLAREPAALLHRAPKPAPSVRKCPATLSNRRPMRPRHEHSPRGCAKLHWRPSNSAPFTVCNILADRAVQFSGVRRPWTVSRPRGDQKSWRASPARGRSRS